MRHSFWLFLFAAFFLHGCWLSALMEGEFDNTDTDTDNDSEISSDEPDTDHNYDTDTEIDSETETDSQTDTSSDFCTDSSWKIERNPINMLILLDRSRSMILGRIGQETYAQVVSRALSEMVATYDNADLINFGLIVFPAPECADQYDSDPTHICLQAAKGNNPVVDIAKDNSSTIRNSLNSVGVCGGTPTCQSLFWADSYITKGNFDPKLKDLKTYVLLATDGAPNCNELLDIKTCTSTGDTPQASSPTQCLDDECTYTAAKQLADSGFQVFVLGVGDNVAQWDYVLNEIALQGGTKNYYPANSYSGLQSALDDIANETVPCEYDLDWKSVPEKIEGSWVVKTCDSMSLFGKTWSGSDIELTYMTSCNEGSTGLGWRWKGVKVEPPKLGKLDLKECSVIELCPRSCEKLKVTNGGFKNIAAQFTCIEK